MGDWIEKIAAAIVGERVVVEEGDRRTFVLSEGENLRANERFRETPYRPRGLTLASTPGAFVNMVRRLDMQGRAPIYVDSKGQVDALLNDDRPTGESGAAWRDWRIGYRPQVSPSWLAWCVVNGKAMPQLTAAEFIEERIADFVRPEGAAMLELAQRFEVTRAGRFVSAQRLTDGSTEFTLDEANKPKANIKVPEKVTLAMRVFEGLAAYRFDAYFRWRVLDGSLSFMFKLVNQDDVLRAAIADITKAIGIGLPNHDNVFHVVALPPAVTPLE